MNDDIIPHKWTLERLEKLTIKELEVLERNARFGGEPELADLCFKVRCDKLPTAARNRALGILSFEKQVAQKLGDLARELGNEFDLSESTARKLGTPHPHALTDNRGDAKTGGAMKSGRFALDRYISYRLRDSKLTLAVILHIDRTVDQAVYAVIGTTDVLPSGKFIDDLELINGEVALLFSSLDDAANSYRNLLGTFAPTH